MRVTPTLVQAAEAVLRALEPALAQRDKGEQEQVAKQVCPRKAISNKLLNPSSAAQGRFGLVCRVCADMPCHDIVLDSEKFPSVKLGTSKWHGTCLAACSMGKASQLTREVASPNSLVVKAQATPQIQCGGLGSS